MYSNMGTGNFTFTDLYNIHGIVQNTMMSFAKSLIIETLQEEFSKDSYYHFVRDAWGFPKIVDLTGLSSDAGLEDDATSRIFIGEAFPYDQKFYPAIIVKDNGMKYVPLSFNRNEDWVQYKAVRVIDGYGNEKIYSSPSHVELAGAWEGSINIEIIAGDIIARDQISETVAGLLTITNFKSIKNAGVVIKPISISGPSEVDDIRDKLYKRTITADIRTEWCQRQNIDTVIDIMIICTEIGNTLTDSYAPNMTIQTKLDIIDTISQL